MIRSALALLLIVASAPTLAESLYVQSTKAKILDNPSFQGAVVVTAEKGDSVTLIERTDKWVKVSFKDKQGWVSALLVGPKPPADKVTIIKDGDNANEKENVRRRASSSASAAAARGLRQDERARANEEGQTNYPALEKVEATKVDAKEVDEFAKGGAGK
jgi:uncharacterized protein YgiM (DUF1202 family)